MPHADRSVRWRCLGFRVHLHIDKDVYDARLREVGIEDSCILGEEEKFLDGGVGQCVCGSENHHNARVIYASSMVSNRPNPRFTSFSSPHPQTEWHSYRTESALSNDNQTWRFISSRLSSPAELSSLA